LHYLLAVGGVQAVVIHAAGHGYRPVTSATEFDTLGSGWGESGVRRSPAFSAAGWTPDLPGRVRAPTLVIRGALDTQAPEQSTRALYDALGGPKRYLTVPCGSHEIVYETQHTKVLEATATWFREQRLRRGECVLQKLGLSRREPRKDGPKESCQ
jgi:pimeloyl-ACP methyl ester carboxylesterase